MSSLSHIQARQTFGSRIVGVFAICILRGLFARARIISVSSLCGHSLIVCGSGLAMASSVRPSLLCEQQGMLSALLYFMYLQRGDLYLKQLMHSDRDEIRSVMRRGKQAN